MKTDYHKIEKFQAFLRTKRSTAIVEGYIGGLVCDLSRAGRAVTAEDTIAALQSQFHTLKIDCGERVVARGGGWGWRFICGKLPELA